MSGQANISTPLQRLRRAQRVALAAARRGLRRAAADRLAAAAARTPTDTGELVNSRFQSPLEETSNALRTSIGFTAAHAVVVHEDLQAAHDDGQAKFLETSIREGKDEVPRTIAAEVKGALG